MSNLLFQIETNKVRAGEIFDKTLKIYEDFIVIRKRHWFVVNEYTITYKHIVRAHLIRFLVLIDYQLMLTNQKCFLC